MSDRDRVEARSVSMYPDEWEAIDAEIFSGHKIAAIKLYRERAGTGLKDAKDAVEQRQRRLQSQSPERFAATGGGCLGVLLLLLVAFAVGALSRLTGVGIRAIAP